MEIRMGYDQSGGQRSETRVSFDEAATVFGCFLGATATDPDHSVEFMKKRTNERHDELRPEYDLRRLLRKGVRGKYAKRYHAGTNLVLLDPDVRKVFRDRTAVNDALRLVIKLGKIGGTPSGIRR